MKVQAPGALIHSTFLLVVTCRLQGWPHSPLALDCPLSLHHVLFKAHMEPFYQPC